MVYPDTRQPLLRPCKSVYGGSQHNNRLVGMTALSTWNRVGGSGQPEGLKTKVGRNQLMSTFHCVHVYVCVLPCCGTAANVSSTSLVTA